MTDVDLVLTHRLYPRLTHQINTSIVGQQALRCVDTFDEAYTLETLEPGEMPHPDNLKAWALLLYKHIGPTIYPKLFDYQRNALRRVLQFGGKMLLAMDQGTGRLLQNTARDMDNEDVSRS
jgi:hypothetical protein